MREHPRTEELRASLQRCLPLATKWSGTVYRFVTVRYAARSDLLSGVGSRNVGGRWNPPGLFNCIYGSLDPHTALAESIGSHELFGIRPEESRPRVFVALDLKLQYVLDGTQTQVLSHLGITTAELVDADWKAIQSRGEEPLSQTIGRLCWEAKLEALIVPSARREAGANMALFPGRRQRGSSWKIHGARDLPRFP
jgi:RES domain-containing protein